MSQLQKHPIQKPRQPDIDDLHIRSSSTAISIDAYADADKTRAEQEPPESRREDSLTTLSITVEIPMPTVTMIHPTGVFRRFPRRIKSPPMRTMLYYIVRTGGPYVLIPFDGLPSPFSGLPVPTGGGRIPAGTDGSSPLSPPHAQHTPAHFDEYSP